MLQSIKTYVSDRRQTLAKTAGFAGGAYLVQRYVRDKLEDLKTKLDQERVARETLRRRFQTVQDDISFTALALLPTLAEQIMEGMDVEALTQELQSRSKARTDGVQLLRQTLNNSNHHHHHHHHHHQQQQQQQQEKRPQDDGEMKPIRQERSVESSIVDAARDGEQSEGGSTASTSFIEVPSQDSGSSGMESWIETSASAGSLVLSSAVDETFQLQLPPPNERHLSDSVITLDTTTTESSVGNESRLSDSVTSMSAASDSSSSKTKAELWAEVKLLTFTRTLTTLYSMTLLCLLTTIQLSVLARFKYVNSVLELEREERFQEQLQSQLPLSFVDLLFGDSTKIQDFLSRDLFEFQDEAEKGELGATGVTEEVERKFLTLSWWILHVGWKDVGERVRRGVEEAFEGVSLKTKLAAIDLHRLVRDVRRRVEHEITFEGRERRVNFLSTLLPPTPEMIQHVLTQGGFVSEPFPEPSFPQNEQGTQDITTLTSSQLSHDFDASPAFGLSGLYNNKNNPNNIAPFPPRPTIPNPTRANCHPHRHKDNGAGEEAEACVECASISHIPPQDPSSAPAEHAPQTFFPLHPPVHSHSRPTLLHMQDPPFLSLVEETRAVIKSPDFEHVLEACLDRATSVLFDGLERNVFVSSEVPPGEEVRIRLAGLLPGLARWSRLALHGLPNELVDNVLGLREVSCLSAIMLSKFAERFP